VNFECLPFETKYKLLLIARILRVLSYSAGAQRLTGKRCGSIRHVFRSIVAKIRRLSTQEVVLPEDPVRLIKQKQLRLVGHLLRHTDTPAYRVLMNCRSDHLSQLLETFAADFDITTDLVATIANNGEEWRHCVDIW
jgi:hypothetical protein